MPPASADGAVWGPFEPLAANLLQWLVAPGETTVDALRLGPVRMLFVPGEPVGEVGLAWEKSFGGASVVGAGLGLAPVAGAGEPPPQAINSEANSNVRGAMCSRT